MRCFVILRDDGCVPEKKGPFGDFRQAVGFAREAVAARPASTQITIVRPLPDGDLDVCDGREALAIDAALGVKGSRW